MASYTDRIKPDDSGITTYLENLQKHKYQIPTFQREIVWEPDNVKKLWDSIYKFYPLGSILIWKTNLKLQHHRDIGGILLTNDFAASEYQYILDGQQRTTSLFTSLFGGKIAGRENFNPTLYVDLTVDHTNPTDDTSYRKRFLYWAEIDDRGGQLVANSGKRKRFDQGLIVRLNDIRTSFSEVDKKLHDNGFVAYDDRYRAQLRRFKDVLDNYRISFIELQGIQVAEVCQIFERINQAGKPLNIFDIVVAKTYRPADEAKGDFGFYLRDLFQEFRVSLGKSNYAEIDDLTLLQTVAMIVYKVLPGSGVLSITDRYLNVLKTEHIEKVWSETQKAVRKVLDFLDNILCIKGPNLVPYRYFYITLAFYFYENKKPDYDFLQKYFWYYSFHNDDLLTNATQLHQHLDAMVKRKTAAQHEFERFLLDRNRLREASYSAKGRLARAILALYANHNPKDWAKPHRSVLSDVYYVLTDKPNLHHIFPMSFVEKSGISTKLMANSLMNIAYLTQITNLQISDKNPLDYLREYNTNGFQDVLQSHLVPGSILQWSILENMPDGSLETFVEERIDLLVDYLRSKLDGISFDVIDSKEGV
jgi:hypothetical protein